MVVSTPGLSGAARPLPDTAHDDPIRASQHIFRVALDALANPGTIRQGIVHPFIGQELAEGNRYLASLLFTLLDHEVSLHVAPGPDADALAELMARRARVSLTGAGSASFVVAEATTVDVSLPETLCRGSLEYPDDGATLLLDMPALDQETDGAITHTLSGPGIRAEQPIRLPGMSPALLASRERAIEHYPTGIDMLLIDRSGRITGLPRTTTIATRDEVGS